MNLGRRLIFILIACLAMVNGFGQPFMVKGKVLDKVNGESLAFVTLVVNGTQQGVNTDIDGKFVINAAKPITELKISYVGYKPLIYKVDSLKENQLIYLEQNEMSLSEVVVVPGLNPAHTILEKVQENRKRNNPQSLEAYQYISYSKMILTGEADTLQKIDPNDTSFIKAQKFLNRQHLFLIEQVTEKKYQKPEKETEKILAARVSGFQNPSFLSLFTQMMSFGFYSNEIAISDKNYLNPIADYRFSRYLFILEDTLFQGKDSVFVISFRPRKGRNFDGLVGTLYISTCHWAIANVIAEPLEPNDGTTVKIQQQYKLVDDHWFPEQLNSDIVFGNLKIKGHKTIGVGRTYIQEIKINPDLSSRDFRELGVVQDEEAGKRTEEYWNKYRTDSLTQKDRKTYLKVDSIGKANKFDRKLKTAEIVLSNKLRYKFLDFDLDKFVAFNDYEGFRLGASFNTNKKFSSRFSLGAYGAFGTKDQALKYGANVSIYFRTILDLKLKFIFEQDVLESGGTIFNTSPGLYLVNEELRRVLVQRMDSIEKYEVNLALKPIKYLYTNFYFNGQYRTFTRGYLFGLQENGGVNKLHQVNATEAGIKLRYLFGEKILKIGELEISDPGSYPRLHLNVAKGFNGFLDGTLDYWRVDLRLEKELSIKHLGKSSIEIQSGYINNPLPYSFIYNGKGSNKKDFSISVLNTFETMRMNEFAANRYAALFYMHDFGRLLYKSKKFSPRIAVKLNAGYGSLNNTWQHNNISVRAFNKGFYEGGLLVNNLFKLGFTSYGIAGFYRFGPYAGPTFKNNAVVKLSIGFNF